MTAPPRSPRALTSVDDLIAAGLVAPADGPSLAPVAREFRIRITPEMRAAMAVGVGVARQFLPTSAEAVVGPEALADPIGDRAHEPVPGLTHRYPDRAILHLTQTCEVYCRFCFRRETVGAAGALPADQLDVALGYISRTQAIREIILTGGDPFSLSARRIGAVMERLAAIPHLEVIRIHTRVPVVAPARITPALIRALDVRPAVWIAIHTNHAGELTAAARAAIGRLNRAGIPLVAQTVLLRGVNDSADVLEALFRALTALRVKPYYLHHCDLARGAGHFRTTIAQGQAIMAALRTRLSGLSLPTYVLDIPGGYGKVPIGSAYLDTAAGGYLVRDHRGRLHTYTDPPGE